MAFAAGRSEADSPGRASGASVYMLLFIRLKHVVMCNQLRGSWYHLSIAEEI
jgi:hypothetical protein